MKTFLQRAAMRRPALKATRPAGQPAPASLQQEALWFLDQMGAGSAYNVNSVLRLHGPLDVPRLGHAWSEVLRRHEVLRSRFEFTDDALLLTCDLAAPARLPVEDIAASDLDAWLDVIANEPYDLDWGPLHRARLARTGADRHVLAFGFHHSVFDGWSLGVLFGELSALYAGRAVPELDLRYGDYACWQRAMLAGPQAKRQLDYWRERLADAPVVLNLPTDRPRPDAGADAGAEYHLRLPDGLAEALRQVARRERVSLYMLLLAAFQLMLSKLTGATDLCVAGVVPGRTRPEWEPLAGYFVNTLVLRGDLSGEPSFAELLARTRDVVLDAHENQEVPFAAVVREVAPDRSLAHGTLYQVMFLLQELSDERLGLSGLDVSLDEVAATRAKCDLTLAMWEGTEGFVAAFEYATDLFDRQTVAGFADQLEAILREVVR